MPPQQDYSSMASTVPEVKIVNAASEQQQSHHHHNVLSSHAEFDAQSSRVTEEEKTTGFQTLIHLIKGYVGPGCLSLPWAFSQLGILGGCLASILLSWWSSHNCWRVLRLKRYIVGMEEGPPTMTYPDVAAWAYGSKFRKFVLTCICVQQLAICTVFLSFVGENTVAVLQRIMDGHVSHTAIISLCMPAVLALSCIPNLKRLSPVTAAGTVLLLLAFGMLGIVMELNWSSRPTDSVGLEGWKVPLAMCAILYSYEGINLILPIETAMSEPKQFGKTFFAAMVIVCIIFATVASLSVLAFGAVDNGSITAFLLNHEDDIVGKHWVLLANTAVTFSVLLTYPLQLFPCLELVAPWFNGTSSSPRHSTSTENRFEPLPEGDDLNETSSQTTSLSSQEVSNDDDATSSPMLRLALVMATYIVAIVIPNVQVLISLAGALAGSSTALLIPPLVELKFIKRTSNQTMSKVQCYILFGLGLLFCLIGTGASMADIVRLYL